MIMPSLLLLKPSFRSRTREHKHFLERRLNYWLAGDFDALMKEGRTIQRAWKNRKPTTNTVAKSFSNLMKKGKVKSALNLLKNMQSSGVLPLTAEVITNLKEKHPPQQIPPVDVLIAGEIPFIDPILYENIDEELIRKAATKIDGAAGPSGLDAHSWRRMLVSANYGDTGKDLRVAVARFARKLCTVNIANSIRCDALSAYTSCRLITLDETPGVRPICIGEFLRLVEEEVNDWTE